MTNDDQELRSLTAHFPTYRSARHFLRILEGKGYANYVSMVEAIDQHKGSPQEQVDWTDPEEWIPLRLSGPERELASKLWRESGGEFNPRYTRGCWVLTHRHELMKETESGSFEITDRGRQFIEDPDGMLVAEIDSYEGVLNILQSVANIGSGKRSDILPDFETFCRRFTTYRSETVIKGALYDRLYNLLDREYILRSGQNYEVTNAGLSYLEQFQQEISGHIITDDQTDLQRLGKKIRQETREKLSDYLLNMDPFKFEALVKFLLEEIGYTDVQVTTPTNDKGVDVIGNIELGVSSVREVIQVKRYSSNIGRPVLDQLRGVLHRFGAFRGTIITTGGFSRGALQAAFERGAAPITLIDGEKLLDLLIENEIGAIKKRVEYTEFDPSRISQFEEEFEG